MRAVVQRVIRASVAINASVHAAIGTGILILLGIEDADGPEDVRWLSNKLINLRIFNDAAGVMNLSLADTGGDILLVSQFTLFADIRKGNRPSYIRASKPDIAVPLYESMVVQMEKDLGRKVMTGVFGTNMRVEILNDGPVTILLDTRHKEL
jgi:D-tyrosyl-tRNA(Tyr) deacylase